MGNENADAISAQAGTGKATLVASRGGHRGSSSRMMGEVKLILEMEGEVDIALLSTLNKKLKEKLEVIKSLDAQILTKSSDDELEGEIRVQDEYNLEIDILIGKTDFLLEKLRKKTEEISKRAEIRVRGNRWDEVKLPKLEIKPFNGNLAYFKSFFEQFEVAVGKTNIDDITKFSYLKNLVTGQAAKCIEGLALTPDNYNDALGGSPGRGYRTSMHWWAEQ